MGDYDGVALGVRFDPGDEPIRKAMGVTLHVARQLDLAAMTPRGELASSGDRLAGQGKPGVEYVVYVPQGKEVSVDRRPPRANSRWSGSIRSAAR